VVFSQTGAKSKLHSNAVLSLSTKLAGSEREAGESSSQSQVTWRTHFRAILKYANYFLDFFFFGTFAPFLRASDSPIAIACFWLVTFLPDLPLLSVPFFFFLTARLTELLAFLLYLATRIGPYCCCLPLPSSDGE
jgi:hypothetical protein